MSPVIPDSHLHLLERRPIVLTTIGPNGQPQSTAIWALITDGRIRTSLAGERQKTKNLLQRPLGTLFAIDPENQFKTIELRCEATLTPDPDLTTMREVITHYGHDFETFPATHEGRYTVDFQPRRVIVNG